LCGSLDVPLSAIGERALDALTRRPPRSIPDALLTSTLSRAWAVAVALGRRWGLQPQGAEWAREIHCGECEGLPLSVIQRDFAKFWALNEAQTHDTFAWPGGETYSEFRARILAGLQGIATAYAGSRVALVTHAGVISQVVGVVRGRPAAAWVPDRPRPLTATEVTWHNGAPSAVLTFDDPDWY
jgi:broad specificity phosphatase PhoE